MVCIALFLGGGIFWFRNLCNSLLLFVLVCTLLRHLIIRGAPCDHPSLDSNKQPTAVLCFKQPLSLLHLPVNFSSTTPVFLEPKQTLTSSSPCKLPSHSTTQHPPSSGNGLPSSMNPSGQGALAPLKAWPHIPPRVESRGQHWPVLFKSWIPWIGWG